MGHQRNNRGTRRRVTRNTVETTRKRLPSEREKKTVLFKKKLTWLGYEINQNGVKPIKDKTEAITKLKAPTNTKELKSFLGSIQHLSKFLNNLSKKTDRMGRLQKKGTKWEWTKKINDDFEQLKRK